MTMTQKAKTRAHMRKNGIDPKTLTPRQFVDYARRHGFLDDDNEAKINEAGGRDQIDQGDGERQQGEGEEQGMQHENGGDAEGDGEDGGDIRNNAGDGEGEADDAQGDGDDDAEGEPQRDAPPAEKPEADNPMDQHVLDLIDKAIAHHNYVDDHGLPSYINGVVKRAVKRAMANMPEAPKAFKQLEVLEQQHVEFEYTHKEFEKCCKVIRRGKNLYMKGAAGSGKTTMAEQIAERFKRDFVMLGRVDDTFQLSGYKNAHGEFVMTPFFDAFVNGKLILLDEMDRWAAEAVTWANAALANGYATFGDGVRYTKHKDCIVVAAGNTFANGPDNIYTAAQALDGATMDRFVKVTVDYDEKLERKLALAANPDATKWVDFVQRCRKRADAAHMEVIISPRASINGAELMLDGFDFDEVKHMTFMAGLSNTDIATLEG